MALNASKKFTRLLPTLRNVVSRSYAEEAAASHTKRNPNEMQFTLACPAAVYYNAATNVRQVDVSSFSGNFGILPNHVPVLAVIKPGVITVIEQDGGTKKFFASSGSVSVNDDNSVQILAEEAVPVEDLDAQAAKEGLRDAQSNAAGAGDELARVEAEVEIEVYEAIIKAAEGGS